MLRRKGGVDGSAALVERVLEIVVAATDGGDRWMDDHSQGMPRDEVEALRAWQQLEATVDGDRHNGELERIG